MEIKDVWTIREASRETGYAVDYLRRLCREGKIQFTHFGQALAIEKASLVAYKEEQDAKRNEKKEE